VLPALRRETERHAAATISRSLETNNKHFQEERERLEKWADDQIIAAERELSDTKARIKSLNRAARLTTTTEEQLRIQHDIREAEKEQRRQRQRIFDLEDDVKDKRDRLITKLEERMTQKTQRETIFTVRWKVE
jgi:predicted  nucleic acid-binding Zn-ribbon protein